MAQYFLPFLAGWRLFPVCIEGICAYQITEVGRTKPEPNTPEPNVPGPTGAGTNLTRDRLEPELDLHWNLPELKPN